WRDGRANRPGIPLLRILCKGTTRARWGGAMSQSLAFRLRSSVRERAPDPISAQLPFKTRSRRLLFSGSAPQAMRTGNGFPDAELPSTYQSRAWEQVTA